MQSFELSQQEICNMTGFKRPADQIAWFKKAGIPAFEKKGGQLCVLRAWAEQAPLQSRVGSNSTNLPRFDKMSAQ